MKQHNFKYIIVLFVLTAAMIYYYGRIDYTANPYCYWDLKPYQAMAAAAPHIDPNVTRPYAYRILGPFLVGLLPFSEVQSFCMVDTVLSFSLPFFLYGFLCRRGIAPATAVFVAFVYLCNKYVFGMLTWDFFRVNDQISLILIILVLECLLNSKWACFAMLLSAGALTREVMMFFVPVAFVYLFENKKNRGDYIRLGTACIPGVVVFVAMRMILSPPGHDLDEAFLTHIRKFSSPWVWGKLLLNAYAPVSLIPLIFYKKTRDFFAGKKYAIIFGALVFFSTAFGTDNERLFAPVFVFVYWFIAAVIQEFDFKWSDGYFIALVPFIILSSIHHEIGRFIWGDRDVSIAMTLISLAGVALILFLKNRELACR